MPSGGQRDEGGDDLTPDGSSTKPLDCGPGRHPPFQSRPEPALHSLRSLPISWSCLAYSQVLIMVRRTSEPQRSRRASCARSTIRSASISRIVCATRECAFAHLRTARRLRHGGRDDDGYSTPSLKQTSLWTAEERR